jgi:hypothetical protein
MQLVAHDRVAPVCIELSGSPREDAERLLRGNSKN